MERFWTTNTFFEINWLHPIPHVQYFMTESTILGESKQPLFVKFLKEQNLVKEG